MRLPRVLLRSAPATRLARIEIDMLMIRLERRLRTVVLLITASLALSVVAGAGGSARAAVPDRLGPATVTPLGTFGGMSYVQYDGVFEGDTSTGAFRVPYRISAPADPSLTNQSVLVEAPHFAIALGARDRYLRPGFLFGRGFVHAGVGWSTVANRILDPTVPDTFIEGGSTSSAGGSTTRSSRISQRR